MTTLSSTQQTAYDSIQSHLSTGFLNGVDEGDVNSVRDTLAGLNATDADAVVDAMADAGLLDKLANESNDSDFLGMGQDGFSADEKRSLFNDLATKLDGDSLARVSDAFANAESGDDRINVTGELADAIATHASSQTKLDYVQAQAGKTEDPFDSTRITGMYSSATLTRYVDPEAAAIGKVLSSMSGSYAEAGFDALSDKALDRVLQSGVNQNESNAGTAVGATYDSTIFEGVVRAAGTTSDVELKARVFDAAGERLGAVEASDDGITNAAVDTDQALPGMTRAMTELLHSDTTGIMRELTFDGATASGTAMTNYAEVMISTGQTSALADTMTDLQFGNDRNENAIDRLDQVYTDANGQQFRENAGALGYFVGAVYAGAENHSSDVKAQQEAISGFLGFVAGKIPLAGGFSAGDATLGQDFIKQAVESAINNPKLEPAQRLELAALPRDPGGRLAVGDDITNTFRTALEAVRRAQED